MLAQSHTPYILLACTIFDVGTVTHTYILLAVLYLMLAQSNTPYILLLYLMLAQSHTHLIFC